MKLYKANSLYYKDREIAIGQKSEILFFLTKMRNLKQGRDFYLEESMEDEDHLEINHPFTLMVPYNKVVTIPRNAMDVIEHDMESAASSLVQLRSSMIEFVYYADQSNTFKKYAKPAIEGTQLINDILGSEKLIKRYQKAIYKNHPILYCGEQEYWSYIYTGMENRSMTELYLRSLDDWRA